MIQHVPTCQWCQMYFSGLIYLITNQIFQIRNFVQDLILLFIPSPFFLPPYILLSSFCFPSFLPPFICLFVSDVFYAFIPYFFLRLCVHFFFFLSCSFWEFFSLISYYFIVTKCERYFVAKNADVCVNSHSFHFLNF
jgi:hypothetical protein